MLTKAKNKIQSGFTIIEVMIVLAIAGLILVVVLIAIPQLQRNQRNSARQAIVARISTEISNYAGNNNGQIPADGDDLQDLNDRYLSDIDILDPREDTALTPTLATPTEDEVPDGTVGTLNYAVGLSCDGETIVAGSARSFALYTELEGGAIYCLDNQ